MIGQRRCRIWPSIILALVLSFVNTFIIFVVLGPSHLKNEDHMSLPQAVLPKKQDKATEDDGVQPRHQMDSMAVFKSQGRAPASIQTTGINHTELERQPHTQFVQKFVSVVHQLDNKPDVHLSGTVNSQTDKVEVLTDWSIKYPVPALEEDDLDHAAKQLKFDRNSMLMVGKPPINLVEVVIGIPTVKRTTSHYLSSTLKQLVKYLRYNETKQCHIVIFSADLNESGNKETAEFIKANFKNEIDAGLIEVIKPDKTYYPKFTNLPLLWKDKPDRIKWRSKQCIDYSLLFAYCRYLGNYYLQLEDDVTVAPDYFNKIKMFIQSRGSSKWSNLQFGARGFIGMLFKRTDLGRLALFVKMYYWIFPVDILFRHFNDIHLTGNNARDVYSPPLFRHVGVESSLKGQTRKLDAKRINVKYVNKRLYKDANNPPCYISTNIEVFSSNTIDEAYKSTNIGFFWGKDVKTSDFVLLQFLKEVTLLRVVIDSGSEFAPLDLIGEGKLETSKVSKDGGCDDKGFVPLESTTIEKKIEASASNFGGIPGVKCIRLTITKLTTDNKGKSRWLLIREIAVWSH